MQSLKQVGNMLHVNVKENESIDKALKRYKKKFEKTGIMKELRARSFYKKPSEARKEEVAKAKYREKMKNKSNQ